MTRSAQNTLVGELVPAIKTLQTAGLFADDGRLVEERLVDYNEAQLLELAAGLGTINNWTRWAIADLILFSEKAFGESYAEFASAVKMSPDTIRRWVWVAQRVPPSRRNHDLNFSYHQEVAALAPPTQKRLLKAAEAAGASTNPAFTTRTFKQMIRDDFETRGEPLPTKRSAQNSRREPVTTPSGLPTYYMVPGAVVRRIKQLSTPGRDGHIRVPKDLYDRLVSVLDDE